LSVLQQYYLRSHTADLAVESIDQVRLDESPDDIPEMLSRSQPHDDDYIIFGCFQDSENVILDIGANRGYSVGSLRAVGSRSKIVSFEAIPLYRGCLRAILESCPNNYGYIMTALSNRRDRLKFVMPVVNGHAITALASASQHPHLESVANNIRHHIQEWLPGNDDINLTFCEFEVQSDRLDSIINRHPELFSDCAIDALKVDVEGLETEVLQGAEKTLRSHQPLIMSESGNRPEGLQQLMTSLGYEYAERSGDKLEFIKGMGMASNGFFVYKDKIGEYQSRGIIA